MGPEAQCASPPTAAFSCDHAAMATTVRVWDLPTRLFHWALAASVIGLVATAKVGGNAMVWHFRLGHLVLALLLFRLVWGFVGGRWSRFAAFVYAPRSVVGYLRGRAHPDHLVGHNPLGAFSVFALLGVLIAQVATGLVSDDEIAFQGPLSRFVSGATASWATGWHKGYGEWLLWGLVGLHVAAVLFYVLVKRHTLVRPMVVGDKQLDAPVAPSRDDAASRTAALVLFAACCGVAWYVSSLQL